MKTFARSVRRAAFATLAAALAACSPSSSATGVGTTGVNSTTTSTGAGGVGQGGAAQGGAGQGGLAQGGAGHGGAGGQAAAHACKETTFGGDRPVKLHVPASYQCGSSAPLLFMLHGYTSTGDIEELYFNLTAASDAKGFLYAHPEGTKDSQQSQFWNATDACCNFYGSKVDDSAYLVGLIDEISAEYNVDPKRVYLFGHSNGAFMAYRMACDHADRIAAIGGLAGAMFQDPSKCAATAPVSVLAIHGTLDASIAYAGGLIGANAYPSATTTVADWAKIDGCDPTPDASGAPLDLDSVLMGADLSANETTVSKYGNCKDGASVALYTMQGGGHIPTLSKTFTSSVVDFLLAQHKP